MSSSLYTYSFFDNEDKYLVSIRDSVVVKILWITVHGPTINVEKFSELYPHVQESIISHLNEHHQ